MFIIEVIIGLSLLCVTIILAVDIILPSIINKPFFWFTKLIIIGGFMRKIIILIVLVLFVGCKKMDDFSKNRAVTNVITLQEGCSGTKVYEIELRDGTKCAVLDDKSITCAWGG